MTINVPSFFAGIATVLLTLTVGFGGGVLMTGAFTDRAREPNKLERRAAEETKPAPAVVASPVPVGPAQAQASQPIPAAQAPVPSVPDAQPAQPAKTVAQVQPPPQPDPAPSQTADRTSPLGPQRAVSLVPETQEQPPDLRDASNKAREAKVRAERRKAERRKQIAERRLREARQNAVSERLRREVWNDDDRGERPAFMRRDRFLDPPAFRLFGIGD